MHPAGAVSLKQMPGKRDCHRRTRCYEIACQQLFYVFATKVTVVEQYKVFFCKQCGYLYVSLKLCGSKHSVSTANVN